MATNDLEILLKSVVDGLTTGARLDNSRSVAELPAAGSAGSAANAEAPARRSSSLQLVEQISTNRAAGTSSVSTDASSDAARIAAELADIGRMLGQGGSSSTGSSDNGPGEDQKDNGSSTAGTLIKALGIATGVGPLAAGLMALFGSRSSSEESLSTMPFQLPAPVSVDAGLTADRQFTDIVYSADGTPRSVSSQGSSANTSRLPATAPIQINVQAMDSRSFLDHSDEIARAVRDAMLHSHSLNDVIVEL